MSGFSADWLAAREPVDQRARNTAVRDVFIDHLVRGHPASAITLLDLGSGTGSTFRGLSPHLPIPHRWRFAENDADLIEAARAGLADTLADVAIFEADLSAGVSDALLDGIDAVTTSAFLDLVSAPWIDDLAATLARHRLPFLAMLTYDGRMELSPSHPFDGIVRDAMNTHQLGDKGFGSALGPTAADYAFTAFEKAGFDVRDGSSDWVGLPDETRFQTHLVDGWATAAAELTVDDTQLKDWHALRHQQIADGHLSTLVGHKDLVALPR